MDLPMVKAEVIRDYDQRMLDELVKRKNKKERAKNAHYRWLTSGALGLIAFFLWLYQNGLFSSGSYDVIQIPVFLLTNPINYGSILTLGAIYCMWLSKHKKYKKEKKKYEDLRKEVVEKRDKYWAKEYGGAFTDQLYNDMQNNFDINVSHKS